MAELRIELGVFFHGQCIYEMHRLPDAQSHMRYSISKYAIGSPSPEHTSYFFNALEAFNFLPELEGIPKPLIGEPGPLGPSG